MDERAGDIWAAATRDGAWVVVTTNGATRQDGSAIMGRGIALEAARRHHGLQASLGRRLLHGGNHVNVFPSIHIVSFPVKHHWREQADLGLIEQSAHELREAIDHGRVNGLVYSVRPGCGNGGLRWDDVRPVIEPLFGDVAIYERKP